MENNHIEYKGKIIEVPQISSDDEACEILIGVDFMSTEDMAKAVVSVANYIESTKSAMQALETALTEKHRAEVEKLKNYAQHKAWCDGANISFCGEPCTCGLDQLLTTNPKEERK